MYPTKQSITMIEDNKDIDLLFRKKLREIYYKVQALSKISAEFSDLGPHLQALALDFYNTFTNTSINVVKNEYHFKNYYSVIIPLENSCFSIPFKFYQLTKTDPIPNLDLLFDMHVNWKIFLIYFYERIFAIRQTLVESDVKILKVLTQYSLVANKKRLPYTKEEIAKKIEFIGKKSKEPITKITVARRLKRLINQNILTEYFLINPWTVGYKLYLYVYPKMLDENLSEWNKWTIFKQYLMNNSIFRVVREPQHAEGELIFPDYTQKIEIKRYFISNNISQLDADPNKSFLQPPVFDVPKFSNYKFVEFEDKNSDEWIQSLINLTSFEDINDSIDLDPIIRLSKDNRLNTGFKFLSFVAKEGNISYPVEDSAKRSGIDRHVFDSFFKFFIEKKVLVYCTRTAYINCNIRFGIMIYSLEKTIADHPILQNFITNLYELPYAYTFIADYALVAYINLPNTWVGAFMSYLSILSLNQDLIVSIGQHLALQSYVKYNLAFNQEEIFNTMGITYSPLMQ